MGILISTVRQQAAPYIKNILLNLLQNNLDYGKINVVISDPRSSTKAERIVLGSTNNSETKILETTVTLTNDCDFWRNISQNLDVGISEAYMLQMLDCDDLVKLFQIYIRNWASLGTASSMFSIPVSLWTQFLRQTNTLGNALHNASFHYDTSNELFSNFLSPDMCYSCPIWEDPEESLETAQRRKVHNIIGKAEIKPEHHILDIGGGWGYLALEAARLTGCQVTVITLSKEQKALGEERVKAAGLDSRITFLLCDYRKCPKAPGGYDRIISVEMIEAVGREFLDGYFRTIHELLNPMDGKMVIQSITFCEQLHKMPKTLDNFLDKYIFPGGYLPSTTEIANSLNEGSDGKLELETVEDIGRHYVKALRLWRESFVANWGTIRASILKEHGPKSDREMEALKRKWIYYFSYCQAGFREGILGDIIFSATRKPQPVSPLCIL